MNRRKRQKDRTLKDELHRSVDAQHITGDQWRNNSRKNEETEPKQHHHLVVDVTNDRSKGQCCQEQYCIGTWSVGSMNQEKFSSVQFSRLVVSDSLQPHESQHARPPCPSPTPGVHSDSRPSSQQYHPPISSSVVPFSSCPQSFPASESSPMSQLCMRWLKYWSFSFSIIPSKKHYVD